jgi:UDP:flavonoid glycosyltransferase YjiC (YdhE family)
MMRSVERTMVANAAASVHAQAQSIGLPSDPAGERMLREPSLSLFPQSFDYSEHEQASVQRFRAVQRPAQALPAWWGDRAGPLVYVTLGTVADSAAVLRAAVAGVARLDATVLVALGAVGDADLGPLGANVRVVPFVDQARLLPNVDLVVHHGGTGTFLGALAHGLPQLVLPQTADQPVNAQIAAAAGLGVGLAGDADADSVEVAARRLLGEDTFRAAAARMRDEMSEMPDPSSVAAVLV